MSTRLRPFQEDSANWLVERIHAARGRSVTLGLCDEVGLGKTHVAADAARRLLAHDFRLAIYVSPNLTLAQQNRSKIASTMVKVGARRRTRYRTAESRLTLLLPAALVGLRGGVLDLKELASAREDQDPSEWNGRASRVVLVSAHTSLHLAGRGLRRERDWLRVLLQWYRRRYARSRVERSRISDLVRVIAECDHGRKSGGSSVSAFARLLREQPRRRRSRIGHFVRKWLDRVDEEGKQPSIRQIREAYRQQLLGEIGPILWMIDEYQQYPELFRKLKRVREKSRDAFILMSATPFEVPEDPDGAMRHEGLRDFLALVDERLAQRMFGGEGGAFESHWDSIRTLVEEYRSGALDEDGVRGRVERLLNDDVQPLQRQLTRCLIRHERPHLSVRGDGESALDDWQPWLKSYASLERLSAHVSPAAWTSEMWNHSPSFPLTSGAVYIASRQVANSPRSAAGRAAADLHDVLPLANVHGTYKSDRLADALHTRFDRPSGVRPIWIAPSALGTRGKVVVFTRYFGSTREAVLAAEAVNGHRAKPTRKPSLPPFRLGVRDPSWSFFWPGWAVIVDRIFGDRRRTERPKKSLKAILDSDLRFFRRVQRRAEAGDERYARIEQSIGLPNWELWAEVRDDLRTLYRDDQRREGFAGTALEALFQHAKNVAELSIQSEERKTKSEVVQLPYPRPPTKCLGTAIVEALLGVCDAEGLKTEDALPLVVARWGLILRVLLALAEYFRRESVQRARGLGSIRRWTEAAYRRSLEAAVRDDDLSACILEMEFMMRPVSSEDTGDARDRAAMRMDAVLKRMLSVLDLNDQRIHILVRGRGKKRSLRRILVPCGLAVTLSDDETDKSGPERTATEHKIAAFNSPFFPMCIVLGTAAEHGLDFHHFCDGVVHWDAPRSAVHWEQRVGRVLRFRHLALRRAMLANVRGGRSGKLPVDLARAFAPVPGDGLAPDWQPPETAPAGGPHAGDAEDDEQLSARSSWPEEIMLALAGTAEHRRFERIGRERTFLRMSLGHPDRKRFLEVMEREARALTPEQREFLECELSRLALDLRPQSPRRDRRSSTVETVKAARTAQSKDQVTREVWMGSSQRSRLKAEALRVLPGRVFPPDKLDA